MTNLEDRLQKLNAYKTIRLTEEEQNMLRSHGAHIISTHVPKQHTESLLYQGIQHTIRIALSTFLFIIFIGSSVSVVANSALPGDPLYSVKLNINEKARGMFLSNPEDKVAWQKSRIENRVQEIKTLAETKTLTQAKKETVNKALDSHVKALSHELNTLSDEEPSTALTVTASLEDNLIANKEAIKEQALEEDPSVVSALEVIDQTLKVVSEQEVKIISKEIDNISSAAKTVDIETKLETKTDVQVKSSGENKSDSEIKVEKKTLPQNTPNKP